MSQTNQDEPELADKILAPLLAGEFGSTNTTNIHQLRESFLAKGYSLEQFTVGLKYLLVNRKLKRINDRDLVLVTNLDQS